MEKNNEDKIRIEAKDDEAMKILEDLRANGDQILFAETVGKLVEEGRCDVIHTVNGEVMFSTVEDEQEQQEDDTVWY